MVVKNSVKRIVFLSMTAEADEYLTALNDRGRANDLVIAMNPLVNSYLKTKGAAAVNTLPYFTNESHMKALERSEGIIEYLWNNSAFLDIGIGVKQPYRDFFVYRTRCSLLFLLWAIEIVANAVKAHSPEAICGSCAFRKGGLSLYIEPEEKYLGRIVRLVARHEGLRYEDISGKGVRDDDVTKVSFKDYAYSLAKFVAGYSKFHRWRSQILANGLSAGNKTVIFTTRHYRMDDLCSDLADKIKGLRALFLPGPFIPLVKVPRLLERSLFGPYSVAADKQRRSFELLIGKMRGDAQTFSFYGIAFADLLAQKIKTNIADYLVGLMLWSTKLERLLGLIKPAAVVSNGNRPEDGTLAELCKIKGIPDILISHGSHVLPKNRYEMIEWGEHGRMFLRAPFSSLALQTPLAEGYLKSFPSSNRIIKTGPLIWGKAVNREASRLLFDRMFGSRYRFGDVKVILHAGTPKPSNSLRLYTYETPDEYVRSIREIADAVKNIPDTLLIVKFRPSKEIGMDGIKAAIPFSDNIILSVEEPFADILGMSDLLVSFSSTTIEEALQNIIPVLLYGCDGRYQHVPAFEITRGAPIRGSAAYHIKDKEDLEYGIKGILTLGISGTKDEALFSPYRYPERKRDSLSELLKT